MTLTRALAILGVLTAAYLALLVAVDLHGGVFERGLQLLPIAPVLFSASLGSYVLRHARWHWLLHRAGARVAPWTGLLAYLAGFAFTATPGKVGELLRIRYFQALHVPAPTVIAAFVFERAMDLVVVLALATLSISRPGIWVTATAFVVALLGLLALAARFPRVIGRFAARLRAMRLVRLARLVRLVASGLSGSRRWLTVQDLGVSLVLGAAAWGLTSWSFVFLLHHLTSTAVPAAQLLAIYPMAMLAGAASMIPGGLGSTEVTIVVLLTAAAVPLPIASLAAIGIRLSTLWFAIACGILSMWTLEARLLKPASRSASPDRLDNHTIRGEGG